MALQQSDIIVSTEIQWSSLQPRNDDGHCLCTTAVSFLGKKKKVYAASLKVQWAARLTVCFVFRALSGARLLFVFSYISEPF